MYRIFRPACLLACIGLFSGLSTAHAADEPDYVLENTQIPLASAARGSTDDELHELDALEPAIAISPEHGVALAVWVADDTSTFAVDDDDTTARRLVNDEFEVYSGLVRVDSLAIVEGKRRVSTMGNDAETGAAKRQLYAARNPAVAWNPVAEEFLVVWEGDDDTAPLVDGEFEIFARRVDAEGRAVGDRIRISVMGDDTATDSAQRALYDATHPSVTVNPVTGEYLVTWQGDDDTAPLVDEKIEIFGRLLDSEGVPVASQFRISTTGADADAVQPDAVFNPVASAFFVAWQADAVDEQNEIFLQQLDAQGALVGTSVQVSAMGAAGDALSPTLAVDPDIGTMLVAWHGDVVAAPLVDDELEIHGSLCDAVATCQPQFRISTMGLESETSSATRKASVAKNTAAAWSATDQHFLVTWSGDTPEGVLVDDEFEIFGAFVEPDGTIPVDEIRISIQGNDAEDTASERVPFGAGKPAVAYGNGNFLTVWEGDTNLSGGLNDRMIVFAQRVAATHTQLELRVPRISGDRRVPDPVEVTLTVTNAGDAIATNSRITATLSEESFPYAWQGCASVTTDGVCELGDVAPDEVVELKLVLTTDHIELGDEQGTVISFHARTDRALVNPAYALLQIFVGVTLEVDGGSGAVDLFWLLLLPGVLLVSSRRRER